jgi:Kef-type K+ transport system membrane component KefB
LANSPYHSLLLITGLAVAVPVIVRRLGRFQPPIVVGEIVAGMIVGVSGLNWIQPSEILQFLADLGFTFTMFLAGMEIDFRRLVVSAPAPGERRRDRPLPLALVVFLLTLVLAFAASQALALRGTVQNPLLMSLILSTTSLGVVLPVLKEKGLLGERYGQHLLLSATVADLATLTLLTIVIAAIARGFELNLLLVLVLGALFFLAMKLMQWIARIRVVHDLIEELAHATSQIRVRGAVALMVGWAVLAEMSGVEVILGAFLAGALVSLVLEEEHSVLRHKLEAVGFGFFVPIFFIMVGATFDIQELTGSRAALLLVPVLLLIAFCVKMLPALLYRFAFGWRDTVAAGFLLSSRLSLIIAASASALKLGQISQAVNGAIILVAIVTSTISPLLFNMVFVARKEETRKGVIISGTTPLAELLARRLVNTGTDVTLVGQDHARLAHLRREGLSVVEGPPSREDTLRRAGADRAEGVVALNTKRGDRLAVCSLARERFHVPKIVSSANTEPLRSELESLDVQVVQSGQALAVALEGALRFPTAFEVLLRQDDEVELGEAVLRNSRFAGARIRNVRLAGDALILSIRRNRDVLVPRADTELVLNDRLALVGSPEGLRAARELLEG